MIYIMSTCDSDVLTKDLEKLGIDFVLRYVYNHTTHRVSKSAFYEVRCDSPEDETLIKLALPPIYSTYAKSEICADVLKRDYKKIVLYKKKNGKRSYMYRPQ